MSARSRTVRCWLIVSATVVALAGAATPLAADDGTLNKAAWALLPVELMDLRDPQTALAFALRATELTDHQNPSYLDTLALACDLTGDTGQAAEIQGKALSLLPEGESSLHSEFEQRLAEFETSLRGEDEQLPDPTDRNGG